MHLEAVLAQLILEKALLPFWKKEKQNFPEPDALKILYLS